MSLVKQINGYFIKNIFFSMFATQVLHSHNNNQISILFCWKFSRFRISTVFIQFVFIHAVLSLSLSLHSSKQDSWIYDKLVPKYCDSFLYLFLVTGNLPSNTGVGKRYIPLLQFFLNGPIRIVYFNLFFFASLKPFQILSAL